MSKTEYERKYQQRFECTHCGHVHFKPIRWTSMNSELYCPSCHSLAFGLMRRTIVSKDASEISDELTSGVEETRVSS